MLKADCEPGMSGKTGGAEQTTQRGTCAGQPEETPRRLEGSHRIKQRRIEDCKRDGEKPHLAFPAYVRRKEVETEEDACPWGAAEQCQPVPEAAQLRLVSGLLFSPARERAGL